MTNSRRLVPDDGRRDATLVIVGEAPAAHEIAKRRPFVGPSGGKLNEWWRDPAVNITRSDCYITNVFPYQVHKVMRGGTHGLNVTTEEWNDAVTNLHERLRHVAGATLIVAVGDIALQALRGHGGVLKWGGSVLVYEPLGVRLIPTVHPAALFRDPSLERRAIHYWRKIAQEWRNPSTPPHVTHHIAPSWHDVRTFRKKVEAFDRAPKHLRPRITVDIETPRKMKTVAALTPKLKRPTTKLIPGTPFIGCIGFALSPDESITIPTMKGYWAERGVDIADVWHEIAAICESPLEKILQNGFFDAFHLHRDRGVNKALGRGIRLRNYKHDTLAKHHVLEADEDHDLGHINSIVGRVPYWKDEGKQAGDLRAVPKDLEQWWRYNGKDATETHYIDARLDERLTASGQLQFYKDHYQKCFAPILDMMTDGICVDEAKREARYAELRAECERLKKLVTKHAGVDLYGKTSLSPTKLKTFLYDTLKLPKQFGKNAKKEKVVSAGEIQIRRLMLRFPRENGHDRLHDVAEAILKFRRADKLSSFYAEKMVDADGRTRCTYTFETDTGRLSSRKNPMGSGMNHQNPDSEALDVFVADPGGLFIEGDLSQAESRIVYVLTKDPELIDVARSMPWEYDSHTENTARILGISTKDVTKQQRKEIGKPTAHAAHYLMMGATMSDNMLKHGVVMTPEECQGHINAYMDWRHQIPKWQQETKWKVIDQRRLVNSWGRVADFRFMRLEPHLYQKACNFKPQCCDGETEVLTPEGWRRFDSLRTGTARVAQWDAGAISFVQAPVITTQTDEVLTHYEGSRVSFKVTSNHRVPNYRGRAGLVVDEAADLATEISVPSSGVYQEGHALLTAGVVRLLAATQADGTLRSNGVEWHFTKLRKIERLRMLLAEAGVVATEYTNSDGTTTFKTKGAWATVCRTWLPKKEFTYELLTLSKRLRHLFIEELQHWDARRTEGDKSFGYVTTIKRNADVVQAVAVCTGYRATLVQESEGTIEHAPVWRVNLCERTKTARAQRQPVVHRPVRLRYVYCVTVPSGLFLIRRNGKVCVTGNSEVAGLINQYGMIPIRKAIRTEGRAHRLRLQKHDSLGYWSPFTLDDVWWLIQTMYACLQRPRVYEGVELTIPVEIKIGLNLKHMIEFKKPPTRREVRLALEQLREERVA